MKELSQYKYTLWRWMRCYLMPWRVRYYAKDGEKRKMFRTIRHQDKRLSYYQDLMGRGYIFYEEDMYKTPWQNIQ